MLDRASVVDEQFINRVKQADFPEPKSTMSLETAKLDKKIAIAYLIHRLSLVFLI